MQGIAATVGARHVAVGNLRLLASQCGGYAPPELTRRDAEWRAQGMHLVLTSLKIVPCTPEMDDE